MNPENKATSKAGTTNHTPLKITERWECNACGLPCRVEIQYVQTPYTHVEAVPRFTDRKCVAGEPKIPDWKRLPDA